MATALTELRSTGEIRRELGRLREESAIEGGVQGRTSVLTLVVWVPPYWQAAADQTLEGLARGHPSRAIMLMPRAEAVEDAAMGQDDSWSAGVELRPLDGAWEGRAAEVITISLPPHARGTASIVVPLLRSDLPVFLRWRGPLVDERALLGSLIGLADRLIVDSSEWPDSATAHLLLEENFPLVASSDLAWRRLEPWRRAIAASQPTPRAVEQVSVLGPEIEAKLLVAWLRGRLGCEVRLDHVEAADVSVVSLDGVTVSPPRLANRSASELLSLELEQMTRDPVFEEAVCALSSVRI